MKYKIRQFLPALLAGLAVTVFVALGPLRFVDRWTQDQLFQHAGVTDTNILIIGIDEEALDQLGPYNTWA